MHNRSSINSKKNNRLSEMDEGGALQEEMPLGSGSGKNPAAVALGRLGGRRGGPARAEKLTAEERKQIATRAAKARWDKNKEPG
ncbi:histone H1 [Azospirillum melinis]|uniref:Histone H1 n=1 Tax=Azospirillum melinis TaxID=328839 RepID=A0ABX2KMI3_9PROT|nr:histone H1 [Azospirillum melinis]